MAIKNQIKTICCCLLLAVFFSCGDHYHSALQVPFPEEYGFLEVPKSILNDPLFHPKPFRLDKPSAL
jgi:hypothetical protein